MDGNAIISLIGQGISTITSSAISAITGAILTTLFLRKNTKAESFEKIKAGKFSDVVDQLLNDGKMTYMEYYKCRNFLKIAKTADEIQRESCESEETPIDGSQYSFDWFIRFYEYASNISEEDMQRIWASTLAREVSNPRSVSPTLLNALSLMTSEQANFFCNMSRFALRGLKSNPHLLLFISTNKSAYENSGIATNSLNKMRQFGLIECNYTSEYVFHDTKEFKTGNKIVTVYGDPRNDGKIQAGNCVFTEDGELLYAIIDEKFKAYNPSILDFTITMLQRRGCLVTINGQKIR